MRPFRTLLLLAFPVLTTIGLLPSFARLANAANRYFDSATSGSTWDNGTTANWGLASGGPYTSLFGAYNDAVFEGTGGTVNVNSVNVNTMTFNSDGYTLNGSTITLGSPGGGPTITVGAGLSAAVSGSTFAHTGITYWSKNGTGTLNFAGTDTTGSYIYLNAGTLEIQSGATVLLANELQSGNSGGAQTFNQTGGSFTTTAGIWLANGTGSSATSTLSGGSLTANGLSTLGTRGNATLNVSGSADVKFNGGFYMGYNGVGSVTSTAVNLSGGSLKVGNAGSGEFILGQDNDAGSSSIFTQTGGTFTFSGSNLYIGNFGAGTQTMSVSAGTFTSTTNSMLLGIRGTATLNLSGTGSMTLPGLQFGHVGTSGETGILNLDGGTLTIGSSGISSAATTANFNFNGGALKAAANSTLMSGSITANVKDGGAVIDTQSFSNTISTALLHFAGATTDSLTKNGSGTLTLTGANTYSGGTTVSAGTLQLGDGTTNPSNVGTNYSVASNATLRVRYNASGVTGAPTFSGVTGAGTLALATGKSFDTGWGVPALPAGFTGTLQIEGGRVVPSTGPGGGLGGTSNIVITNGGQLALYNFGNNTLSQNLTIAGTGYGEAGYESAIRLANAGQTTILSGTVALSGSATLGAAGTSSITNVISGGADLTIGTSAQNGTVILSGGSSNTYAGNTTLTGTGMLGLAKTGGAVAVPGNMTLSATGTRTILYATQDNQFGSGSVLTFTGGLDNRFELKGTTQTVAGIDGPSANYFIQHNEFSPGAVVSATSTLNINGSGTYSFGGTIRDFSGGTLRLTKSGSGTQTISLNPSYTGDTTVNDGVLSLTNTGNWTVPGNIVIDGGTYNLTGGTRQVNMGSPPKTISFGANGGTLSVNSVNFYPSPTAGATLTISTAGGSAPQALINASATSGTFGLNTDNDTTNFNIAAGAGPVDLLMAAPFWNNGTVQKSGNGVMEVSANSSSFSGTTTLTAGTLKLSHTGAVGGSTTVNLNGGTLQLATDSAVSSKNIAMGGDAAVVLDRATSGAAFDTTFGNFTSNTGTRTLTVTKGSNVSSGTPSLTFSGTLSMSQSAANTNTFDVGTGASVFLSGSTPGGAQTISLVKAGAGTLVLNGNYGTWDAGNNIGLNGGTLELRSIPGDSGVFRNITAAAGTTLSLSQSVDTTFYSGLTANGSMTLVSDRTSAGAGLTHTLGTLGVAGAYTLDVMGGDNVTSGTARVAFSGATTLSGNTVFNITNALGGGFTALTLSGAVGQSGGARSITKDGIGDLNLSNANTYSGGTQINAGRVAASSSGSALGTGSVTVASGGEAFLQSAVTYPNSFFISGDGGNSVDTQLRGAIRLENATVSGSVTMQADASIGAYFGTTGTISGVVGQSGGARNLSINKSSASTPGTVMLSGANTYTGTTTIHNGTLTFNNPTAGVYTYTGGTITIKGASTMNVTVTGGGANRYDFQHKTFEWDATGGGTLSLGTAAINFVLDTASSGTSTFKTNGGVQNSIIGPGNVNMGSAGHTVIFDIASGSGATDLLVSSALTNTSGIQKTGAGKLTLTNANSYSGATNITQGTLILQNTNASPSYSISSGATLEMDVPSGTRDMSAATFSGTGIFNKTGGGTLQWGGAAATFSLGSGALMDIQGGQFTGGSSANEVWTNNRADLNVASGAIFDAVEATTVGNGGVFVDALSGAGTIKVGFTGAFANMITFGVDNGSDTFSGSLQNSSAAGSYVKTGTGTQTLSGVNTYTGTTTVNNGVLILSGTLANSTTGVTLINDGELHLGKTAGVNAIGAGASTVNVGNNAGTAGILKLLAADQLPDLDLFIAADGTFDMNGFDEQIAGLWDGTGSTSGMATSATGTPTLTLASNGDFAGTLTGTLALTKMGASTMQTLRGIQAYTGNTTVDSGTLRLIHGSSNNTIASSPVIDVKSGAMLNVSLLAGTTDLVLASGQKLQGNGTILGNLTVGGGIIAPGSSPGLITQNGNQTWNNGDTYEWEVAQAGAAGVDYDSIDVIGVLDFTAVGASGLNLELIKWPGGSVDYGDTFALWTFDNLLGWDAAPFAASGKFTLVNLGSFDLVNGPAMIYADVANNSGAGTIWLTGIYVPEPSTYALAMLGLAALGLFAWRKKSAATPTIAAR